MKKIFNHRIGIVFGLIFIALIVSSAGQLRVGFVPSAHAMGMGWGGGGGGSSDNSDLPAPVVTLLTEIITSEMQSPNRIAASDSGIVVTDSKARLVHILRPNGSLKFSIAGVRKPLGCTIDGEGKIYIGDKVTGSVHIFDRYGVFQGKLGQGDGEFNMPSDLAWDSANNLVLVVDSKADQVRVYSTEGTFLIAFGGSGSGDGQFLFPTGIVYSQNTERIYIADHNNARVQVFNITGTEGNWAVNWTNSFGEYGDGDAKLIRPQGLAVDTVEIVNADGTVETKDRIYITDAFHGQLKVLDENGLFISSVGEYGLESGQMALPLDAVIDPYGRLLVTSYRTGKILVFGIDDYTEPPDVLSATVTAKPSKLKTRRRRRWIKLFVEIPEATAENILPATVLLAEVLAPDLSKQPVIGDHDLDGIPDLKLRFGYLEVLELIPEPGETRLSLTGELSTGQMFEAEVTFTVVSKRRKIKKISRKIKKKREKISKKLNKKREKISKKIKEHLKMVSKKIKKYLKMIRKKIKKEGK